MRQEEFSYQVGESTVQCQVRYSPRRRRSIAVRVINRQSLRVNAPAHYTKPAVLTFLSSRQPWLRKQLDRLAANASPWSNHYGHNSLHPFQGQPVRLHWQETHCKRLSIQGQPPRLDVKVPASMPSEYRENRVQQAVQRWYRQHALKVFDQRLRHWVTRIDWLTEMPVWRLRRMRSRWGSCTARGHITLNTHLIQVPPACLDYVIVHELCHVREMNHGSRFYALQAAILPDWKERKRLLRDFPLPEN